MHYNLHERITPKRRIPYKKLIITVVIALALVATYFVVTHHTANFQKPPAQNHPA